MNVITTRIIIITTGNVMLKASDADPRTHRETHTQYTMNNMAEKHKQ